MFGVTRDQINVVSMMGHEQDRRNLPLREVDSYWHALCGNGVIPSRSQVDPRGIEGALEFAFLAERIAPGMAKIRVAGSHLSDVMGMETSGMPLSSLFAPAARDMLSDALTRVFAEPAILRTGLLGEDGFGKPSLDGQLLLMPLRSDMGDVSRALGCLVTRGRIGRAPRRFLLDGMNIEPVFAGKAKFVRRSVSQQRDAIQEPRSSDTGAARQFNEPATPFVAAPPRRSRPELRIVVSNDD